LKDLSARTNST